MRKSPTEIGFPCERYIVCVSVCLCPPHIRGMRDRLRKLSVIVNHNSGTVVWLTSAHKSRCVFSDSCYFLCVLSDSRAHTHPCRFLQSHCLGLKEYHGDCAEKKSQTAYVCDDIHFIAHSKQNQRAHYGSDWTYSKVPCCCYFAACCYHHIRWERKRKIESGYRDDADSQEEA